MRIHTSPLCFANEGVDPDLCLYGPRQETHSHVRTYNILSLPCSGFSSPLKEKEGRAGEHTHLPLCPTLYPSPSLLRLLFFPPSSVPPSPKYQLTGYPGNSAGRLPVAAATQHGHQAALHRKVRGPTRQPSSWIVANRTGPGWEAYMPEGIKFLLSGTSVSHEVAPSSKECEPHANLPGSVTQA